MKRICRRLLALVLCAALALPGCAAAETENAVGFADVPPEAWYAESVEMMREKDLMNGVGGGRFDPEGVFTRAQLATVLYRMAGSPAVQGTDAFDDTQPDTWYSDAVLWASQNGIVDGYGNGLYGTNDPTTQEQLTVMLWRDAGGPVADYLSLGGVEKQASRYAYDAVVWAKTEGLIYDLDAYAPKQPANRAQVADMVCRYLKLREKFSVADDSRERGNGETEWTPDEYENPRCVLMIEANGKRFYASFEDNSSAKAFMEKLNAEPLTVAMHDYGGFEKVGQLPWELTRSDAQITTRPGDVILYEGNQIAVYYGENQWNFTRLAAIGNKTGDELLAALGSGDVTVSFSLEWGQ